MLRVLRREPRTRPSRLPARLKQLFLRAHLCTVVCLVGNLQAGDLDASMVVLRNPPTSDNQQAATAARAPGPLDATPLDTRSGCGRPTI
jgi:hypothetical protein